MKNSYGDEQAVAYYVNPVTGEISFSAFYLITIEGQQDVSHNVALYGWCNFYGGEKDDVITQYGWSQHIYGQGGNEKWRQSHGNRNKQPDRNGNEYSKNRNRDNYYNNCSYICCVSSKDGDKKYKRDKNKECGIKKNKC